jgi:hypothetical protein
LDDFGPLGFHETRSFGGGRYIVVELDRPVTIYRSWAPGTYADEFGGWWSLKKPKGTVGSKLEYALLPEWGKVEGAEHLRSQATRWVSAKIPKGTRIAVGEIGAQGPMWHGGSTQLLVDGWVQKKWRTGGGILK